MFIKFPYWSIIFEAKPLQDAMKNTTSLLLQKLWMNTTQRIVWPVSFKKPERLLEGLINNYYTAENVFYLATSL